MNIHAIITTYGNDAFGLHSPQLPNLFAGTNNLAEYQGDALLQLLSDAGAPEAYTLITHHQRYLRTGDHELFIRLCQDSNPRRHAQRLEAIRTLHAVLDSSQDLIEQSATNKTGEHLFIATCPSDTVGWIADQLGNDSDASIVCHVGPRALFSIDISTRHDSDGDPLDRATTIQELMDDARLQWATDEKLDFLTGSAAPPVTRAAREVVAV